MHDGDFIVLQFEDLCTKRGAVGSLLLWNLHKSYTVAKYDKNDYFSHNFGNIHPYKQSMSTSTNCADGIDFIH